MKTRRFSILAGLALAVMVVTAATTAAVQRLGPFYTTLAPFDSTKGGQAGGMTFTYLANDSLKIGDVVYDSIGNRVAKSVTALSYSKRVGVVVGGARTSNRASYDSTDVGTLAATSSQRVIVAHFGRVWTKTSDSVYIGNNVIAGTAVAGTIKRASTIIDSSGRIFGRAVFTIDSGKKVLINLKAP